MVQNLNRRSKKPAAAAPPDSRPISERIQRRADARRLEILRAAAQVFRERGIAAASMREIAAAADLSTGNLYHYFAGKDELLYFCQDRALDRMIGEAERARKSGARYLEQLTIVIAAHLNCMLDELEGSTAHLQVEALPDAMRVPMIEKRDRYERAIRRLLEDGIAAGEFSSCDPTLVTRAMLGALNWTSRWFRPDGEQSVTEVIASLTDYLIRGLVAAPLSASDTLPRAQSGGRYD